MLPVAIHINALKLFLAYFPRLSSLSRLLPASLRPSLCSNMSVTSIPTCVSCHESLSEGETHALQCGHVFHTKCTAAYMQIAQVTLEELRCPVCRMTSAQVFASTQADGAPDLPENAEVPVSDLEAEINRGAEHAAGQGAIGETAPEPPVPDAPVEASNPVDTSSGSSDDSQMVAVLASHGAVAPAMIGRASAGFAIEAVAVWDYQDPTVTCSDCSETCVLSKSRLMSKQAGTFRCPKCHTVHTKIYQAYGGGMSKKLLNIPEGQLSQFFKDARDMNFKQIGKNLSSLLDKHEVFEQSYSHGGAFKPLSVWEKEGFDAAAVETMSLPHDVKADRMFGLVYRVPLLTVVETGTRGTKSVTQADVKKKAAIDNEPCATHAESEAEAEGEGVAPDEQANDKAAAKRSHSRGSSNCSDKKKPRKDKKKKKKKKKNRSSSSSSSSSDRSSSSSSCSSSEQRRKAKAKKERKKADKLKRKEAKKKDEAKAQAKAEKAEAKAAAKAETDAMRAVAAAEKKAASEIMQKVNKRKSACQQHTKKLGKCIAEIQKTFQLAGVNLLEASAKKPLELALKALLTVNDECGLIANGVDNTNYDVPKDLTGMIAAAKKHQAVFAMNVKAHVSDARNDRR